MRYHVEIAGWGKANVEAQDAGDAAEEAMAHADRMDRADGKTLLAEAKRVVTVYNGSGFKKLAICTVTRVLCPEYMAKATWGCVEAVGDPEPEGTDDD